MQRPLPERKASLWLVSNHPGSQALRFAAVGVINTLTDFSIFALLALALGVNTILANTVSYSAGILSSYALNSRFTFRTQHHTSSGFMLFCLANVLSLFI